MILNAIFPQASPIPYNCYSIFCPCGIDNYRYDVLLESCDISLGVWFTLCSMSSWLIHVACGSKLHSFQRLSNMPLHGYTACPAWLYCMSFHLSVNFWVVSIWGLLRKELVYKPMAKYPISIISARALGMHGGVTHLFPEAA